MSNTSNPQPIEEICTKRLSDQEYAERKASNRININNILAAACVMALTILLQTDSPIRDAISRTSVIQLGMALPLLVTSSLAYSRLSYRTCETETWNSYGRLTHTVGYVFILNAVALMLHAKQMPVSAMLFIMVAVALFFISTSIDVRLKSERANRKARWFIFHVALIATGYVLPIILYGRELI